MPFKNNEDERKWRKKWWKSLSPERKREKLDKANNRAKLVREFISNYKINKGCVDCGYNKHPSALDFDHVEGVKDLNVCFSKSITQAKREIEKCEVVCANCHRIRTYNRIYPCKPDIFKKTYELVMK